MQNYKNCYYQVFHIEDMDGVEPLTFNDIKEPTEFIPEEQAEEIISAYSLCENIQIRYGGNSAFYSLALDFIQFSERF